MADAVVGTLRAIMTLDTAQFEAGARKGKAVVTELEKTLAKLGDGTGRLTAQAERMVKALSGDRLLSTAHNLTAAVQRIGGASRLTEAEQARVNRTVSDAIAKYTALGHQAPKVLVDLANATKSAGPPTDFLTAKMVALGAAVGTFASQVAMRAVRALVQLGKDSFTSASQVLDLSDKTGETTESIQRMQFVAGQTGTSLEAMTNAAFQLRTRLAGGNTSVISALAELRKESGDASLTTRSSADQILAALSLITDGQTRLRLGALLFGRTFSEVAAAVTQGYADIAKGATVSSDEQIRALDRAADRWSAFVANAKAQVRGFLGEILLQRDAMQQVREEVDRLFPGANQEVRLTEMAARLRTLQANAGRSDVQLPDVAAITDYVKRLAEARAELARLTPAQRAQIDAAQQLGESVDDLEAKFGLTAGTLRILNAETKDYEQNLKKVIDRISGVDALKTAREFETALRGLRSPSQLSASDSTDMLKAFDAVIEKYRLIGGSEGQRVVDHFTRLKEQLRQTDGAALIYLENERRGWEASTLLLEARDEAGKAFLEGERIRLSALDLSAQDYLDNERRGWEASIALLAARDAAGNEFLRAELSRLESLKGTPLEDQFSKAMDRAREARREVVDMWRGMGRQLEEATVGNLGSLFFGGIGHDPMGELRAAADEAEQEFLKIRRSGRATAEELTLAMKRWREAEDRANHDFGERWKQFWGGLKQTFLSVLDDMLQHFVRSFLGGLLKGIASARLGQALGNALMGVGTGAAVGAGASGVAGAAGGTGAGAAGFLASPAFWTNPYTIAAVATIAAVTWGVTKKGWFRGGEEGVSVNPRRDQFVAQVGGSHALAARLTRITGMGGGGPLFAALQAADSNREYESAQSAIVRTFAGIGIRLKSFAMGGFVPPGVVQPAILHGGRFGEDIVPRSMAGGRGDIVQHNTISLSVHALNTDGFREVFRRQIIPALEMELLTNQNNLLTTLNRVKP